MLADGQALDRVEDLTKFQADLDSRPVCLTGNWGDFPWEGCKGYGGALV